MQFKLKWVMDDNTRFLLQGSKGVWHLKKKLNETFFSLVYFPKEKLYMKIRIATLCMVGAWESV